MTSPATIRPAHDSSYNGVKLRPKNQRRYSEVSSECSQCARFLKRELHDDNEERNYANISLENFCRSEGYCRLISNDFPVLQIDLSQDISKRLSLPADLHIPESFLAKQAAAGAAEPPLTRTSRRRSLSEIGFGRSETYIKLDKLGEVRI